jgi:hypothetical protein
LVVPTFIHQLCIYLKVSRESKAKRAACSLSNPSLSNLHSCSYLRTDGQEEKCACLALPFWALH